MGNYNLSDNVNDDFSFDIRGKKYIMRYPRTEELDAVQELNNELQTAQEEKRDDDVKAISSKLEDYIYDFITPEGHETPVKEVLAKENIKVLRNFKRMINTELSLN
jgi:hypothetical protein